MPATDEILRDLIARYPDLAPCEGSIRAAHEMMLKSVRAGGKIMLCGNGGSAADCSHIAAELLKSLAKPRRIPASARAAIGPEDAGIKSLMDHLEGSIPAVSLPDQGVIHSAFANDVAAEYAFAQLVWGLGRKGDVLWGISTSGNSKNVIHALALARRMGIATLGLLGRDGGAMRSVCDVAVLAPGANTQQIQERHLPIYHTLCVMLEEALF